MTIPADKLWALAYHIHQKNGGYYKSPVFKEIKEDNCHIQPVIEKEANKVLVREHLGRNEFSYSDEEYQMGQVIRNHFKSYMLLVLANKCNDFQKSLLQLSQKEEFQDRDFKDFGIVSCGPMVYFRDQSNKELMRLIRESNCLDVKIGGHITNTVEIVEKRMFMANAFYAASNLYFGKINQNIVKFYLKDSLEVGKQYTIKAKVSKLSDGITYLNYVKCQPAIN